MIGQTTAQPKSIKLEVAHGETSASMQVRDTTLLDFGVVALIVVGVVFTVYMFKRLK